MRFILHLFSVALFSAVGANQLPIDNSVDTQLIQKENTVLIAPNKGTLKGSKVSAMLAKSSVSIISSTGDVIIDDDIVWSGDTILSIIAADNVVINGNIEALGDAAGLVISPNQGQEEGSYSLSGKISLLGADPMLIIEDEEYKVIKTIRDLRRVKDNLQGNYALARDLELGEFTPIAFSKTVNGFWFESGPYFGGKFDGLGHSLHDLEIVKEGENNKIALFARVAGPKAVVRNVNIIDAYIEGSNCIAGIAGVLDSGATIDNCYVSGEIVGHLVEYIRRDYEEGTYRYKVGGNHLGGVVGLRSGDSYVKNSHSDVLIHTVDRGDQVSDL